MPRCLCVLFCSFFVLLNGCLNVPLTARGPWFFSPLTTSDKAAPCLVLQGPPEAPLYRTFSMTVSIENPTGTSLQGAQLQLELPPELEVVSLPGAGVPPSGTVSLPSVATVPAGKKGFLDVRIKAAKTGIYVLTLKGSLGGEPISSVMHEVQVTCPKLEATVISPPRACPKTVSSWQFVVKNTGDAAAHAVFLTWDIPAGVRFLAAAEGNYASGRVSCNLGSIFPGQEKNTIIKVTALDSVDITGQVKISALGVDPVTLETKAAYRHRPVLDVALFPSLNAPGIWEIEVRNSGSIEAAEVNVSCQLFGNSLPSLVRGVTKGTISETSVVFGPIPKIPPGAKVRWELHFPPEVTPEMSVRCSASHLAEPIVIKTTP